MNEASLGAVLDHETAVERVESGAVPEWAQRHFQNFRASVTGKRDGAEFPCFFGKASVEEGRPLYTFVESTTHPDALYDLRDALLEYLDVYEAHGDRVSFAAFFRPPERPLEEAGWHEQFWHVLQFLNVEDPEPWPDDIPTDPDDPYWEFCFGGDPIFPTARAPFYETRQSRYCPVGLEVTFQPRTIFEGITGDTDAGQRARDRIRSRLDEYDDAACPHADLGEWGQEGDREWPQYLLSEDETAAPDTCPMQVTPEVLVEQA
jgi:FPC/CPF motif-containing protein YcgG